MKKPDFTDSVIQVMTVLIIISYSYALIDGWMTLWHIGFLLLGCVCMAGFVLLFHVIKTAIYKKSPPPETGEGD